MSMQMDHTGEVDKDQIQARTSGTRTRSPNLKYLRETAIASFPEQISLSKFMQIVIPGSLVRFRNFPDVEQIFVITLKGTFRGSSMNIVNHLTCFRNLGISHDHSSHRCTGQSPYWVRLGGRWAGGLINDYNVELSM